MKRVLVVFVAGIVLFGACSAQRVNAQNANIAQKIIGTWVAQDGTTLVFNANGNLTLNNNLNLKYGVTDTKLALNPSFPNGIDIFDISISSDGKTLILTFLYDGTIRGIWLTKK